MEATHSQQPPLCVHPLNHSLHHRDSRRGCLVMRLPLQQEVYTVLENHGLETRVCSAVSTTCGAGLARTPGCSWTHGDPRAGPTHKEDKGTGHKRQGALYRYGKDLISYAAPYATAITSSQLQHSLQPAP